MGEQKNPTVSIIENPIKQKEIEALNALLKKDASIEEIEEKVSHLFTREKPNQQSLIDPERLEQRVKELVNEEYNKRLNQIEFLAKNLQDEKAKEALKKIVELLKADFSFFKKIDEILEKDKQKAYKSGTYNKLTNVLYSVTNGSLGGGMTLMSAILAGFQGEGIVYASMVGWGATSAGIYINSLIQGYKKQRKQKKINNKLEVVGSLFDEKLLDYLIAELSYNLKMDGIKILNTNKDNIDYSRYIHQNSLPTDQKRTYEEINQEFLETIPEYVANKKHLETLESIQEIVLENEEVLPNISFLNEFTGLVNEIYKLGKDAKSVEELANNIIEEYKKDKKGIKNDDLLRLLKRSGITKEENDLHREIFISDLAKIIQTDYIKFLEQNEQDFRHSLIQEMTQRIDEILPFNDSIIRQYLSKGVEEATLSSDFRSDYEIENISYQEILKQIQEAKSEEEKNIAINFYKQKNEFEENKKSLNVFKLLEKTIKSGFYKFLIRQSDYKPE